MIYFIHLVTNQFQSRKLKNPKGYSKLGFELPEGKCKFPLFFKRENIIILVQAFPTN